MTVIVFETTAFGATGMIGQGLHHEPMKNPDVASFLEITPRPQSIRHRVLTQLIQFIHDNPQDLSPVADPLGGHHTSRLEQALITPPLESIARPIVEGGGHPGPGRLT